MYTFFYTVCKKNSCHCIDFEFILEEIQQHISQCKQADCDSSDFFFSLTVTVVDFYASVIVSHFVTCFSLHARSSHSLQGKSTAYARACNQ